MTKRCPKVRAFVEISRVSNLPTCLTNVLVGFAVGGAVTEHYPWSTLLLVAPAICALYVAGMALNDAFDAPFDLAHRPTRPIPSGRISRRAAFIYAIAMLAAGAALLAGAGIGPFVWGLALIMCIIAYDIIHKHTPVSALLMGICRGLVYCIAAVAVGDPSIWSAGGSGLAAIAGAMASYIVLLTVIARHEHVVDDDRALRRGVRTELLLPAVVLLPAIVIRPSTLLWPMIFGASVVLWLLWSNSQLWARPPRTTLAVTGWLAGICLVDGFYLTLLDQPVIALAAAICFILTIAAQRVIAGS